MTVPTRMCPVCWQDVYTYPGPPSEPLPRLARHTLLGKLDACPGSGCSGPDADAAAALTGHPDPHVEPGRVVDLDQWRNR